ncbi:MAG: sulfite exporter TauE/SafE family protein [Proteobacteria bacterium]|nr:sulfite exporter TauE/SafE family protein [Pseudomonadota bacterium]
MWNRFSNFAFWFLIAFVLVQIVSQFIGKKLKQMFPKLISSKFFPAGLGAVTGLIPCGLLIPAYIGASSMPSKSMSVLAIFFFFAGTLPALLMSQSILQQVKKKVPTMLQPWLNSGLGIAFLLVQVWMTSKH